MTPAVSVTRAVIGRVRWFGDQRAHPGLDDVVAALAVGEHAQLVVQFRRAVHADRHADAVLGKKLDDRRRQQRGVGGEAEIDEAALRGGLLGGVSHHLLQQREIHQRFAAEECDVDRLATGRLRQQKIHRRLGRLDVHELRLAFGRRDFVFAELVAVRQERLHWLVRFITSVCSGKSAGGFCQRLGTRVARHDDAGLVQFFDQFFGIGGQPRAIRCAEQFFVRLLRPAAIRSISVSAASSNSKIAPAGTRYRKRLAGVRTGETLPARKTSRRQRSLPHLRLIPADVRRHRDHQYDLPVSGLPSLSFSFFAVATTQTSP